MMTFAQRFVDASRAKETLLVLGMDPDFGRIKRDFAKSVIEPAPEASKIISAIQGAKLGDIGWLPEGFAREFTQLIGYCAQTIFALREEVIGVKFQIAYFEEAGPLGLQALSALVAFTKELGLLVIMDAKRGDIGSTFTRYLNTYLSNTGAPLSLESDAMTVNPLVGTDTWELFLPYLKRGKGIFLLTYPTAPGAEAIMEAEIGGQPLWRVLGFAANDMVVRNLLENEPASLGLVMGALRPPMAERIREVFPGGIFLVPGVGTQGGSMKDAPAFTGGHNWALFPVSRALLYSYADMPFDAKTIGQTFWKASLEQARKFNSELRGVLRFI
jgi:orotidine-5'-phosphate decarboxylase